MVDQKNPLPHFTQASGTLTKEFTRALDQAARDLGRKNRPDDRVDWEQVNRKMTDWWLQRGYRFP